MLRELGRGTMGVVLLVEDTLLGRKVALGAVGEAPGGQLASPIGHRESRWTVRVGTGAQAPNSLPSYPSGPQWAWASGRNNWTELAVKGETTFRYFDRDNRAFHVATYRP